MRNTLVLMVCMMFFAPSTYSQTTVVKNFVFEGINRSYRLYIPASYVQGINAPLVFNLHGYGSNNIEQELYADFRPIADTAGFLLVHPNGTPDFNNTMHWNTFGTSTVNDVGFLSALIDTIASTYSVDLERVYSTGMSNGGFMSFALACSLAPRIAAVASVTGTITNVNLNSCIPSRPVPVMQIHGTLDATVPYNGNFFFAPVQSVLNFWISHNACNPQPAIIPIPDIDPNDGSTAELIVYSGGNNGSEVQHYKITGGGHSWPGAPINLNSTNMDFKASAVIWDFFRKFDINGVVTSKPEIYSNELLSFGPNPASGRVNIQFTGAKERPVKVFDIYGRLLERYIAADNSFELILPRSGIFFVELGSGSQRQLIKLINR